MTIVGNQWWWEIRYPKLGVVTANELHVPVSDPGSPTPTFVTLESVDVIHSFWVPQLAGKMDVIPNKTNRMWIEPRTPGTYVGQCAEYLRPPAWPDAAGGGGASAGRVRALGRRPAGPARDDPAARAGRELFASLACINCHTVRGTTANGVFGPDLTHLMSRWTIGAGAARNTHENLQAWVNDPATLKHGALMPAMKLSRRDLDTLTAYLVTLK